MHSSESVSLWAVVLGLVVLSSSVSRLLNHLYFNQHEPQSAILPFVLLVIEPPALLALIDGANSTSFNGLRLLYTYAIFLSSLSLSIILYRISPFHPLAQYPGPLISKATHLWDFWKAYGGRKYLYHSRLHEIYGPYVRTGPNEISVTDITAVTQILRHGGLDRGRFYDRVGQDHIPPSIMNALGEVHAAKRRVWDRALNPVAMRDYEPLIVKRTTQFVSRLAEHGTVDIGCWIDMLTLDIMGDLIFGGGFEMLRAGRDVNRVGERIRGFARGVNLLGQIPWIMKPVGFIPHVGQAVNEFDKFAQDLAIQRAKNGAAGGKDLWYYIADEAELEKEKPTLENAARDAFVAVIAASDTTAYTLTSAIWLLLSNPECYQRVQQEIDSVIANGDDPFDAEKHRELHYLSGCMFAKPATSPILPLILFWTRNETLRLHPALPSNGGTRQVRLEQPGRFIAGRYFPPGTSVSVATHSIHRNPDYFSHPNQFLPERWLPDSKLEKHEPSAFIPFSLGPANCAGQKFAMREMFGVLCVLFRSFEMKFADGFAGEEWPGSFKEIFIVARGPLMVTLDPRNHASI
ncbi:cytochrome P450 [Favolaschia claudopus]|uniref:Cytochrome P450 n=1 Tax=Favolaschia claudopus TaxID=2862362 RepID=A0AAV9ZCS6_9AGAR